ncbi:MAG: ABC transporter permease subunit [bacterium]
MKAAKVSAFIQKYTMILALVLVTAFFAIRTGGKTLYPGNINNLISQNAYVFVLASGMLLCILTGGNIDLSVGSVVCFTAAIGCVLMKNGANMWVATLAMLGIGLLIGAFQGFWIARIHVPPFIATLAGYLAFRGLGTSILRNNSVTGSIAPFPKDFLSIFSGTLFKTPDGTMNIPCVLVGLVAAAIVMLSVFWTRSSRLKKGYEADTVQQAAIKGGLGAAAILLVMTKLSLAGGIPVVLLWVAGVVLVYSFITSRTIVGRHFYVVGGNMEAARLSGVNTRRIMFIAYLNMAILTAISAMTVLARFTAANADAGKNFEMDAISACVVGGVSASGGAGTILGMVIGATLIGVINLGMFQISLDANYQKVIKGVVLLAAVVFDILSKKRER